MQQTQRLAAITDNLNNIPTRQQQAKFLMKHYSSISHLSKDKGDRLVIRHKREFTLDPTIILATTEQTKKVIIKYAKNSSVMEPDNISNIHLKLPGTPWHHHTYNHCQFFLPILSDITPLKISNIITLLWGIESPLFNFIYICGVCVTFLLVKGWVTY